MLRAGQCQWGNHFFYFASPQAARTSSSGTYSEPQPVTAEQSHIWNPYEVYSRYMPGIFHVYVGPPYIHGIYYVYAKYIRILVLCISWSFNVVNPCHGWGQSNVEDITFQHSIILRESNATWFHGIYLTYACIHLVYARHIPCWVIFNVGTLTGTLWK